jgi:hypothetical protein
MQSAWATFAKDPVNGPGWTKYTAGTGGFVGLLGANGGSGLSAGTAGGVDGRCGLFKSSYDQTGSGNSW